MLIFLSVLRFMVLPLLLLLLLRLCADWLLLLMLLLQPKET